YWEDEKISEQARDLMDLYRLTRKVQGRHKTADIPRQTKLAATALQVAVVVMAAVFIAFLAGVMFVMFVPGASREAISAVVVPVFVASLFAENVLWRLPALLNRFRRELGKGST